ncbi:hypothetical protein GF380_02735 [Candidatus Uhrbacteria bacterium]|nr:hypothetical protein [Candidatus Uhrbacteria bacterium]
MKIRLPDKPGVFFDVFNAERDLGAGDLVRSSTDGKSGWVASVAPDGKTCLVSYDAATHAGIWNGVYPMSKLFPYFWQLENGWYIYERGGYDDQTRQMTIRYAPDMGHVELKMKVELPRTEEETLVSFRLDYDQVAALVRGFSEVLPEIIQQFYES